MLSSITWRPSVSNLTQVGQEIWKVRREITWALYVKSLSTFQREVRLRLFDRLSWGIYIFNYMQTNKRFSCWCQATNIWTDIRISFLHRALYFYFISKYLLTAYSKTITAVICTVRPFSFVFISLSFKVEFNFRV